MNMEVMTLKLFINFTLITSLFVPMSAGAGEGILGDWLAENGKTQVMTYPCANNDQTICSTITWLKRPRKDANNIDPSKRDRDLIGVEVGTNMTPNGKNKWVGEVYSAKKGETFPSTARLNGDVLKIKGCLTKSRFICKTRKFNRILEPKTVSETAQ